MFHVLCQNSSGCNIEHLQRIYNLLKKRGVNCLERDGFGKTALHYAVESGSVELVKMLIGQGADPTELDDNNKSPMILYLQGNKCQHKHLYFTATAKYDQIFEMLAKAGAKLNHVYTENTIKSECSTDPYSCTLLVNIIRKLANQAVSDDSKPLRSNVLALMHFGATLDIIDSDGRDAMMYAIRSNNTNLVNFLIENKQKLKLTVKLQDKQGKSPVHIVVNPCKFGSFENV